MYTVSYVPFASYTFADVKRLERYFNGQIGRTELTDYVLVEWGKPGEDGIAPEKAELLAQIETERESRFFDPTEGDLYSFRTETASLDRFKLAPKVALYLNDPSGAFHYDLYLQGGHDRKLLRRTFFSSAVRATLLEDVSEVTQASNSLLPHVRSDVAEHYRGRCAVRAGCGRCAGRELRAGRRGRRVGGGAQGQQGEQELHGRRSAGAGGDARRLGTCGARPG